jgi:alpha-L-rhamnosidase
MNQLNRRQFIRSVGLVTGGTVVFNSCDFYGGRNIFGPEGNTSWLNEAHLHVLTPASDRVLPVTIGWTEGNVHNPEAMLGEDGESCRLIYEPDGITPVAVLDFGAQSVGGYAIFKVTAKTGLPVVRLAYACHPDGLSETGCFSRETSARYLGPDLDLPVLPGNVNRHEIYSIPRTGLYIAPLIQGQTRYIRLQLDTPGTSVDVESVIMVNSEVHDRSPHDGFFLCSDERLNRLWYISTWTMQIASFPNHNAFKVVENWLLPRKLEHAEEVNLSVAGTEWKDVVIETVFEIRSNPHHVSGAGLAFRAQDFSNAYLAEINLENMFRLIRREGGKDHILSEKKMYFQIIDGERYALKIEATGSKLTTSIDGKVIDETIDTAFTHGRVGFFTPKESWPLFEYITVTDAKGRTLLSDNFTKDLSKWDFRKTLSYVSDGAKRDRLVWSGDLYFAQRNAYYAFSDPSYMRESLLMLAFNQTPEGYVHAAPYPEINTPPSSGDYGHFASDEFAAWLIPAAWDHLLFTNDTVTLKKIWPAITKLIDYLRRHTDQKTGLFVQRHETSKQAGNLRLGNLNTRSYMNILLWGAYRDAARIANHLGQHKDEKRFYQLARQTKEAVNTYLWDEQEGFFREALEAPGIGFYANALALAMEFATMEQAKRIAPRITRDWHGKFQSLASRGKFEYGFGNSGLQAIYDHNWMRLLDESWEGATTTTECMTMITKGWGDESHPDTAIAGHFSAYVLGIVPEEPGFKRFIFHPQPAQGVTWAKGLVPTPSGPIQASWTLEKDRMTAELSVPGGTMANLILPEGCSIFVNNRPSSGNDLKKGSYVIEARNLPDDAWKDLTVLTSVNEVEMNFSFNASSSVEKDGWSVGNLVAPQDDKAKRGYSSIGHQTPDVEEWIEIDLGKEVVISGMILLPRSDASMVGSQPGGFPRDFVVQIANESGNYETVAEYTNSRPLFSGVHVDLYTVIGYPSVKYIRIKTTRLGRPAAEEPGIYRLQLERIRILQP